VKVKSRGLGRKELVMDFREYTVTREGNEIVVSGTIHEPVNWDFSIRMCEDDLAGLAKVAVKPTMLAFIVRAVFRLPRFRRSHWSSDRATHVAGVKERRAARKVAAAEAEAKATAKETGAEKPAAKAAAARAAAKRPVAAEPELDLEPDDEGMLDGDSATEAPAGATPAASVPATPSPTTIAKPTISRPAARPAAAAAGPKPTATTTPPASAAPPRAVQRPSVEKPAVGLSARRARNLETLRPGARADDNGDAGAAENAGDEKVSGAEPANGR
jgi:hypothetical protein